MQWVLECERSSNLCGLSVFWHLQRQHHSFIEDFRKTFWNLGDSGGPLLQANAPRNQIPSGSASRDLIVGVTSYGPRTCDRSKPGVYTNVGYFYDWIQSVINGTQLNVSTTSTQVGPFTETSTKSTSSVCRRHRLSKKILFLCLYQRLRLRLKDPLRHRAWLKKRALMISWRKFLNLTRKNF